MMSGERRVIPRYRGSFFFTCIVLLPSTAAWWLQRNNRLSFKTAIPMNPKATTLEKHSKTQQGEFQFYDYYGAKISYRKYSSANLSVTQQQSRTTTLLLIHPIGIGQASWFWDRFISDWCSSCTASGSKYTLYAVNLLGCGVTSERNAMWNMTEQTQQYTSPGSSDLPMSLPLLLWVEQCEAMIEQVICQNCRTTIESTNPKNRFQSHDRWNFVKNAVLHTSEVKPYDKITIVAQGGLAPIAATLAARNPSLIKHMILTSPPTYKDLMKPISESELRFNYIALCNPLVEKFAFSILESQWAIQFFSNLFLFAGPCDSEWINRAIKESGPDVRRPVQLFNAGYCFYRSYQDEFCDMIQQTTLILRGHDDSRESESFKSTLQNCTTKRINGKNVLPWESSIECCAAIKEFLIQHD